MAQLAAVPPELAAIPAKLPPIALQLPPFVPHAADIAVTPLAPEFAAVSPERVPVAPEFTLIAPDFPPFVPHFMALARTPGVLRRQGGGRRQAQECQRSDQSMPPHMPTSGVGSP